MLIVSKHRDYYDSAVGTGIDKTIVYEIQLNELECPEDIKEKFDVLWHQNFLTHYGGHITKGE